MDDDSAEMFCPACGERIQRGSNFCRYCGEPNRKDPPGDDGRPRSETNQPGGPATGHSPGKERGRVNGGVGAPSGGAAGGTGGRDAAGARGGAAGGNDGEDYWTDGYEYEQRSSGTEENPEPWETDYAERVEGRAEEESGAENPWRAYLPAGVRQESPIRPVLVAVGLASLGIGTLILVSIIMTVVGVGLGFSLLAMGVLGTFIGQYLGFAGLSLWYLRWRGLSWDQIKGYLGVRKPSLLELLLVVVSWVAILILALVTVTVVTGILDQLLASGAPEEGAENSSTQILEDNPAFVPAAILAMFLVVGPCEELLFRGVIQGRLRERFSAVPAIAIASAVFAVVHVIALVGDPEAMAITISALFATSLVLGAVFEYTKSVVVVAVLHAFHNSMIAIFVYVSAVSDIEEGVVLPLFALLF